MATSRTDNTAALRAEIAALQQDKLRLQSKINELLVKPSAPEDFAAALQQSVDKIQTQLSSMTNSVCNFAVKDFRLETNVQITVTPLGTVQYRFAGVDEKPDPATLSRLTLQLTPIPKQSGANTFTSDFQPGASIDRIEGLTGDQQNVLHKNGIDTVADFLSVGTRARSSVELVALLKIDRTRLAGFLVSAQLLTLKGIDSARAAVLVAAGIDSLVELAELTPEQLVKSFSETRIRIKRTDAVPVDVAEATRWIAGAQSFTNRSES